MSGESYLCLQDPQNISEKTLFLPPPVYFIVSLFDGEHSVLDIQAEYMRRFGDILFAEKIQQIIDQLEEGKGGNRLKGVVAPHIDFQRGGFCYAFAHRAVKEESSSSRFILLGI